MNASAKLFKSLADETRLRILVLLLEHGELCICDLMNALELPQSTVSRHVAYLKNAGWLQDRRGGVWMYYSLKAGFSALHTELLSLLRIRCADTRECAADRVRLTAYANEKNCI